MQLYTSKVAILVLPAKYRLKSSVIFAVIMYQLLRSILFLFPPEPVHNFSMNTLRLLCRFGFRNLFAKKCKPKSDYTCNVFNIKFPNKVGLAAGFDKNARYLREVECLGFGFVEIGTVTPSPQAGNDKPRLFRLPKDNALINRMGFNNDGVAVIAKRLKDWKEKKTKSNLIIGGNIGKDKATPNTEAWKDYIICFTTLHPYVDYFVVNVSSPNTPGLRDLQEKESLRKILVNLQTINNSRAAAKPILLKIAPDLSQQQIDDVIDLAMEIKLDGLVATNTTISREGLKTRISRVEAIGSGGLSGLPLKRKSTDIIRYIHHKTKGQIPIIASGGIFTGDDAKEKLEAGASLVQVWTGFVYEGPGIVKKICKSIYK